jgi:hypothetical protein
MRTIIIFISCIFALCSCEDYVYSDIEGQWQLRTIQHPNNTEHKIDSVFYSFKKDVFRYLNKVREDSVVICFGSYNINDKQLDIQIKTDTDKFSENWHNFERSFVITKYNSSEMQLNHNDTIYLFRKY